MELRDGGMIMLAWPSMAAWNKGSIRLRLRAWSEGSVE